MLTKDLELFNCFYSVFKTLMILIRGLDISFKFRFSERVLPIFFYIFGILYIVRNVSCQWCIFHISILCKILEFLKVRSNTNLMLMQQLQFTYALKFVQFSKETFLFFYNINNFDDFEVHSGQNHLLPNFVKKLISQIQAF